jgi:hypothetical protein
MGSWLANFRLAPLYASLLLPFTALGLLLLVSSTLPPAPRSLASRNPNT